MKQGIRTTLLVIALVAIVAIVAVPAFAQAPAAQVDPEGAIEMLADLVKDFITTSGLALVVPLIVQILKRTGLVPDGKSGLFCAGICVALWVTYTLLQAFNVIPPGFMDDLSGISEVAARILQFVIAVVLPLFGFSQARAAALPGVRYSLSASKRTY